MESAIQQRRERSCLLSLGTETVEISWWDNILNALRKQKKSSVIYCRISNWNCCKNKQKY